ncbi:hypothetical protein AQUCO_00400039v1 [Aquilegia coerulea]|uniref:BACK domain-containing protein n=1 Tax=Aquilegia coerulea TaxID=218851 RepID=A0A2G5ET55_AQUCA|nr:hypothetical protein AQUCO_00400039v1 [Aquilegia coerulea]
MASSSSSSSSTWNSNNSFVILELKDPFSTETDFYKQNKKNEIFISNENISHFSLSSLHLTSHIIKVQANRNNESSLDSVSIEWNLEIVMYVLKFIHGFLLNISIDNFIPLMEGAFFFGVEAILAECMAWFSEAFSTREKFTMQIPLESIVELWSFGLEHAIGCIPEQCTGYLARNFMWAISCCFFLEVPFKLISCCLKHPHLTVDSEKHLAEALLVWLKFKTRSLEGSSVRDDDNYSDILKMVRVALLPLWFAAGKKKSCYFSEFADKSISAILDLINNPSTSLQRVLSNGDLDGITIRVTKYTERIDLSGCPQITSALLLLSLLPCSHKIDFMSQERIEESLTGVVNLHMGKYGVPQNMSPTLFEAVRELDVSKCPYLHLEAAIKCFCKSFPSLKILKASHCLHFRMATVFHLVQSCPLLNELYFNADISPVISTQVTTVSTCIDGYRDLDVPSYRVLKERPLAANISKLILEGRTEIEDLDLIYITLLSGSLCYLNLRGCMSVTDIGISKLISKCLNLHSIVAGDTNFGTSSILALCSDLPSLECFPGVHSTSLASRLQKLHIGGCKSK